MDTDDLGDPELIAAYFARETERMKQTQPNIDAFLYTPWQDNLVQMLSQNANCKNAANSLRQPQVNNLTPKLRQSFRTVGEFFQVIDQNTESVLVPYGRGKELITLLNGQHDIYDEIRYLREAQQYSVNLYPNICARLQKETALVPLGDTGVVCLREEYYDSMSGVTVSAGEMQ